MPSKHWSVTVERNGESILTIGHNSVSGKDLDREDEALVRDAAHHLLLFVGPAPPDDEDLGPDPTLAPRMGVDRIGGGHGGKR